MPTFVVEDGTGKTDANSYVSVAYADDYFACLTNPTEWSGADVAATGSLVLGEQPSDGDTMTIDEKTYTFQTTLTNVDGNIEIGSDLATTQTRVVNAINLTQGSEGEGYAAAMTKHRSVTIAAFDVTAGSSTLNYATITAVTAGDSGNGIALDETFTSNDNFFVGRSGVVVLDAAIQDIQGVYTDETTAAGDATLSDVNLLASTPQLADAYYFGSTKRFDQLTFDIGTAASDGAGAWEYWTGSAWAAVGGATDGTSGFQTAGTALLVTFNLPVNWETTSINSSDQMYFVRARVSTAGTTPALAHQVWREGIYLGGGTAGSDEKEEALRVATQTLDVEYNMRWWGVRSKKEQALDWPRNGVGDRDGYAQIDVVPKGIKDATCEMALRYLKGEPILPDLVSAGGIKRKAVRVGPISQDITYADSGKTEEKTFTKICLLLAEYIRPPSLVMRG